METRTLPERIVAMKTVSYDVDAIVEMMVGENDIRPEEVTLEMIMERIEDWVSSDLNESRDDLIIYQDQDGGELNV